jgi:hypothetical protein
VAQGEGPGQVFLSQVRDTVPLGQPVEWAGRKSVVPQVPTDLQARVRSEKSLHKSPPGTKWKDEKMKAGLGH